MKKILAIALIALASTTVFAATMSKTISSASDLKAQENTVTGWGLRNPSETVSLSNMTTLYLRAQIVVDTSIYSDLRPNDPVMLLCAGKSVTIQPGSGVVCELKPGDNFQLQIKAEDFKNGSSGNYSILDR